MREMWRNWRHITKLDPARTISDEDLKRVATSGTDALLIGGTRNVTRENVASMLRRLKPYDVVKIQEPSNPANVVFEDIDYLFIPSIINSADPKWIVGLHADWIRDWASRYGTLPWDKIQGEAYIVLNPRSAVGIETKAKADLSAEAVAAYAVCADRYMHFPIVYIEYSGTYGNPELVQKVRTSLSQAHLFYGGGIDSRQRAREMAKYATIVVGNVIYEDINKFKQTLDYE
jgi:phosphoglycerol geranylgeranyltransferase